MKGLWSITKFNCNRIYIRMVSCNTAMNTNFFLYYILLLSQTHKKKEWEKKSLFYASLLHATFSSLVLSFQKIHHGSNGSMLSATTTYIINKLHWNKSRGHTWCDLVETVHAAHTRSFTKSGWTITNVINDIITSNVIINYWLSLFNIIID